MSTGRRHRIPFLHRRHHDSQDTDYFGDHSSELVRIVLFFSIVTAGTAFWACFQCIDPFILEGRISHYKYPGKILLFAGALLLSTSIVSIVQAGRLMRLAVVCVIRAISIVLILEILAGSTAVALECSISAGFFNKSLLESIKESYSVHRSVTFTTNEMQKTFQCCGIEGPEDWINSTWHQKNSETRMHYPASCCIKDAHCDKEAVHNKGCGFLASQAMHSRLQWTYICAFTCIFVQITSLLMLTFLESKV